VSVLNGAKIRVRAARPGDGATTNPEDLLAPRVVHACEGVREDAPAEPGNNLKAMRVRDLLRMSSGQQTEPARPAVLDALVLFPLPALLRWETIIPLRVRAVLAQSR